MADLGFSETAFSSSAKPLNIGEVMAEGRRLQHAGNWSEVLTLWKAAEVEFPDLAVVASGLGTALRLLKRFDEADACYVASFERFAGNADLEIGYARVAADRSDWAEASRRWEVAMTTLPDHPAPVAGRALALERLGKYDESEGVLVSGKVQFPDYQDFIIAYARLATARADWPEALKRWRDVEARLHRSPASATAIGIALVNLGQLRDAEAVFAAATAQFRDDFGLAMAYATFPAKEGRWTESVNRLKKLVKQFPGQPAGFAQLGGMLRLADKKDEARRVLSAAAKRLPNAAAIATELARLGGPDLTAVIANWQKIVTAHPDDAAGYAGFAEALSRAGESDRAEQLLLEAQARLPPHFQITCGLARLASDRSDWEEAITRWQQVMEIFPRVEGPRNALAQARWNASLSKINDYPVAEPSGADRQKGARAGVGDGSVIALFESLGEDCEFGFVQRDFGLEPLGLLRFAGGDERKLLRMLKERLNGVGDPHYTKLIDRETEYFTSDTRFGLYSHTFVPPYSVQHDAFLSEQCKRLGFLKRKLLRDLEKAEKVFVITAHKYPSDHSALELHNALNEYGPNRLLYVRAGVPGAEAGSIEKIKDGLVFGYLEKWGHEPPSWNIKHEIWLKLCQRTMNAFELTPS